MNPFLISADVNIGPAKTIVLSGQDASAEERVSKLAAEIHSLCECKEYEELRIFSQSGSA